MRLHFQTFEVTNELTRQLIELLGKWCCVEDAKGKPLFRSSKSFVSKSAKPERIASPTARFNGFYFLDRDKRGEFKKIENLKHLGPVYPSHGRQCRKPDAVTWVFSLVLDALPILPPTSNSMRYLAAMGQPGGGRNASI